MMRARLFANGPPAYARCSKSPCNSRRKIYSVTVVCDGLLVESEDGGGECDQGDACQALELQDGRVVARGQAENTEEYGGEG
jgi:hypothetical protein